jgi:hypothetical protein
VPVAGSANEIYGVYRSLCCGIETSLQKGFPFAPCTSGKPHCKGSFATWSLIRPLPTRPAEDRVSRR